MGSETKIEWADATFNPWMGCTKVSPACDHCYAERYGARFGIAWGPGQPRRRTSAANWELPRRWNANAAAGHFVECSGCGRRGDARTWDADIRRTHPRAITCCPDRKLIPARPRVFCASLADVFDNEVPVEWRADLLRLIADTPNLDWLQLTKRVGNVQRMMTEAFSMGWPNHAGQWERWPELFKNVWLGATVVNQTEADRDIPKLLAVPAARRFLSIEPMLGPVALERVCVKSGATLGSYIDALRGHKWDESGYTGGGAPLLSDPPDVRGLDWVIVGGESGPHARPMSPDWARSLKQQCQAAGVPFFMKQMGGVRDKRGALSDLDEDLRVREFPV